MEAKHIIKFGEAIPVEGRETKNNACLKVSEFFYDTIQGEGRYVGQPAAFLRLAGCAVNCKFCDTAEVWKKAQSVDVDWLIEQIIEKGLLRRLSEGHHLVITGGSPLLQQGALENFLQRLDSCTRSKIFVEVENECTIYVDPYLRSRVDCWNNSPKLSNSEVAFDKRYSSAAMDSLGGSFGEVWYKFVVSGEQDWKEIQRNYILPGYAKLDQIYLMPMGANFEEYSKNREAVIEMAIRHRVKYSPREHISIWDKKTGI